jgi:hypothetical protein
MYVLLRCALFVVHELILLLLITATPLMVHAHGVTYVFLRCAPLVVHELILLLLCSSWFMCMKWHTCCYAVHSSWGWCKGFICGRVKTRVTDLPNLQLVCAAYQYFCQSKNVDKNLFQLDQKESFGDDSAHNPLQIAVKPCFRRRRHGMSWPFSNYYRCSYNNAGAQISIARCC